MPKPDVILSQKLLLPELKLTGFYRGVNYFRLYAVKESEKEVCPRCATLSESIYDHRIINIKDEPMRDKNIFLEIKKRRFWCKTCKRPFTEPIAGVLPRRRTTQRYRRSLLFACEKFLSLSKVIQHYKCSSSFVYSALYEQLELRRRKKSHPWPEVVGIDEHAFKKAKKYGANLYNTMIVNINRHKLMEIVDSKQSEILKSKLSYIAGRENVKWAVIDMCDPYRKFIKDYFPNARIVADKFHVLRLLNPAINKARMSITGDKRSNPIRKLLLCNRNKLEYYKRNAVDVWLETYPKMKELYNFKEALSRFYRMKGYERAKRVIDNILEKAKQSIIPEIQSLYRTLKYWKDEILNYFLSRRTNAMTEGFNNKAKLVKRMAYGYKSFNNFRLRVLNACA